MKHDPLCEYSSVSINHMNINYGVCTCDIIQKVRIDEKYKCEAMMRSNNLFYQDVKSMSDEEFEMYLDAVRQVERENAAHRLAGLVYEALGEASMSWSEIPSGTFDSEKCAAIGEKLISVVKSEYMT